MEVQRVNPSFVTSLLAGAMAGLSVDLLFYPIDTVKTRLQSAQGFWKSGGFSGVYRGMGSVAVGSAPGASIFFVTYESAKSYLSKALYPEHSQDAKVMSPAVHMLSGTMAEMVRGLCLLTAGCVHDPRAHRGGQVASANVGVRSKLVCGSLASGHRRGRCAWPVQGLW